MIHETESDRIGERAVADRVGKLWGVSFKKLPSPYYHVDYALTYGESVLGWVEIKRRTCSRKTYPTLMLDFKKWMEGIDLYEATALPFILLVNWTDGDFFYSYDPLTRASLKYGGRTFNTRDENDIEPVVFIPVSEFRKVEGKVRGVMGTRIPRHVEDNLMIAKKVAARKARK